MTGAPQPAEGQLLDDGRLRHILEAIANIRAHVPEGAEHLVAEDARTREAVLYNIVVIGEAAAGLSAELRERHPEIEWQDLADIRDRVVRGYFSVDTELARALVRHELPDLHVELSAVRVQERRRAWQRAHSEQG